MVTIVPVEEKHNVKVSHNNDFSIHHCSNPTVLPLGVTAVGKFQLQGSTTLLSTFCLQTDPNGVMIVSGAVE